MSQRGSNDDVTIPLTTVENDPPAYGAATKSPSLSSRRSSSSSSLSQLSTDQDLLFDMLGFEKSPGYDFWEKVQEMFDESQINAAKDPDKKIKPMSWETAVYTARINMIVTHCESKSMDPALYLMETAYIRFTEAHGDDDDLLPSFKRDISKLMEILLDRADDEAIRLDDDSKYSVLIDPHECPIRRSLLHVAAQYNQFDIAKELVKRYPGLLYVTTQSTVGDQDVFYPIELALNEMFDEVSALLISSMSNSFVRSLFTKQDNISRDAHSYNLKSYINDETMKETVVALLDCFIDPSWPYMPKTEDDDTNPKAWQETPDVPLRYHFYYQFLDADGNGRPPNDDKFDAESFSPLHLLVMSKHNRKCIRHPVVRMLVRRKWEKFARTLLTLYGLAYLFFLMSLIIAGVLGCEQYQNGPLKYETTAEIARLVFEVIVLIMTFIYLILEIKQMTKEKSIYFQSPLNYRDLAGIFGIFIMAGLRIADHKAQWSVLAIVFMINVIGIFKYAYLWETGGLYTNTLTNILMYDLPKFAAVFCVLFVTFTGGLYFALTAAGKVSLPGGLSGIILKEFRAVSESNPFGESYSQYNVFLIILILFNMFFILVVMMNVLIAQLSSRYEVAQEEASVQYDIDKALMVTRIESSRIKLFNLRLKYYRPGVHVNDPSVVKAILADWKKA